MSVYALPARVDAEEAQKRVLDHLPGARYLSSRLLHHPYAGFVFDAEQQAFGKAMHAEVRMLVDLRSGSVATSDPWPSPVFLETGAHLSGPGPRLDEAEASRQARHGVVRTLLHKRLSLRRPRIRLSTSIAPLYKPNWLLALRTEARDETVGVLVDALTGNYHTVDTPGSG